MCSSSSIRSCSSVAVVLNRHSKHTETELLSLIDQAAAATTIANAAGWMHEVTRYYVLCTSGPAASQICTIKPPAQRPPPVFN